jgi:alkylated DNA repair dioxygenase AlkB
MTSGAACILKEGNEAVYYLPSYFDKSLFERLKHEIDWNQRQITMFGKTHDEPRLTAWFGPEYTYSGVKQIEKSFPEFIDHMRQILCSAFDFPFNAALLNYYRHGQDHMGWHRDNEKSMDQRCIASVSFGEARRFSIRNMQTKKRTDILLEDGSLLLMQNLQTNWQHCLPKMARVQSERINLTFRHIST